MTGATLALGQKVEGLFLAQCADFHVQGHWFTVGEVAKETRVTKKTARKYLEVLKDAGFLERYNDWYGSIGYRHVYRLSTKAYLNHYTGRKS